MKRGRIEERLRDGWMKGEKKRRRDRERVEEREQDCKENIVIEEKRGICL